MVTRLSSPLFVASGYFYCSFTLTFRPFSLHSLISLSLSFFIRCILCYLFPVPFSFSLNASLSAMEFNRAFLAHFVAFMTSGMFKEKFSVVALEVRHFLEYIDICSVSLSIWKPVEDKSFTLKFLTKD